MTNRFSNADLQVSQGGSFQVTQTLFGYVLLSNYNEIITNRFPAKIRKVLGVFFLLATVGLWFTPNTILGAGVLSIKFLLTALYLALSVVLLSRARRNTKRELQVDLQRGELRAGFRDSGGTFRLEGVHAFDDVDVVSIWVPKEDSDSAFLFLRLFGCDIALVAAQGTRSQLEPYRTQLARDLCAFAGGVHPVAAIVGKSTTPLLLGPRIEHDGVAA